MRPKRSASAHALCVALAAIAVSSAASTALAVPGGERVDPIVRHGRVRTFSWMRGVPRVAFRDLGPLVGLRDAALSYSVAVGDVNADGWADLVVSHHSQAAELLVTEVEGGAAARLATAWRFVDDLHQRKDRHGCALADVDRDGLLDVYCAKGARRGTVRKWNELWMQNPDGTFTDRAAEFGVEDVWGRGRFPTFLGLNGDEWPDLFVGNDVPRTDRHPTPNRTFVNRMGERLEQVHLGVTRENGDRCSIAADYDGDGRDDLLVCGRDRMHLFHRDPRRFRDVTAEVGLPRVLVTAARFADLDGDGRLDLVFAQAHRLVVEIQGAAHRFSSTLQLRLRHGHGLAVGDPDGDGDPDIYVVEGCVDGSDMPDWLVFVERDARSFRPRRVARVPGGCGDSAEAFDFDQDGMDEFVVLNGGGVDQGFQHRGAEQLLTLGDWEPPPAG
jgi:VCBS repeat protein/FG-GAP repeat protein